MIFGKPVPQILSMQVQERRRKGRKGPLRLKRPPRQRVPLGVERSLRADYLRALARARELVNRLLIPRLAEIEGRAITLDTAGRLDIEPWPETLARIFESIRAEFTEVEASLHDSAAVAANQVSAVNKERVTQQLRSVLGVDVFVAEPDLAATLAASVNENVGLITSVPGTFFREVEATVLRQFRSGQRASSIAPEIARRFRVSRTRAAFIARDQVSKLNGDLTRTRQTEAGIPGYIWRTSLDERVRGSDKGTSFGPGAHDHAKLEGTHQKWNKPPIVDEKSGRRAHPGGDFN